MNERPRVVIMARVEPAVVRSLLLCPVLCVGAASNFHMLFFFNTNLIYSECFKLE